MDVGQNGRPRGPQMEKSSLVLTIQLLGYLILTHTQIWRTGRIGQIQCLSLIWVIWSCIPIFCPFNESWCPSCWFRSKCCCWHTKVGRSHLNILVTVRLQVSLATCTWVRDGLGTSGNLEKKTQTCKIRLVWDSSPGPSWALPSYHIHH